jgi:molybdate transport system substrate-binding protein
MNDALSIISSMAPKAMLAELTQRYAMQSGHQVKLESLGGVDVKRQVRDGKDFDVVVLARDAIDELIASYHLVADSKTDIACSGVAVAIRSGAPRPELGNEEALRRTVLAADTIGCSTGPSGVALRGLFERLGIAEQVSTRIITPPPGVPVGALVASGDVALGFQQLSELLHIEGIDVLAALPAAAQIVTTFSAAIGTTSQKQDRARALIVFLASPANSDAKERQGMNPP